MRNLLIIYIISIFTMSNISGQEFGSPDSEWVYDYSGGHSSGITKVLYEKDTIIGHRNVQVFIKHAFRYSIRRDSFNFALNPIYIHSKDGIVEYSKDKINFDTLYNYNAEIGQSWMIYRHDLKALDSMKIVILDTFQSIISNRSIFSQQIEWTHYFSSTEKYSFIDTVYNILGSRWVFIFPFDFKDVDPEGGFLRCFKNDELGVVEFYSKYQSDYEYDCDNLTSTSRPQVQEKSFRLYPNPIVDELMVESEYSDRAILNIMDVMGRVIYSTDILSGNNTMDMSWMPTGYYLVIVNGKLVGRVVKI